MASRECLINGLRRTSEMKVVSRIRGGLGNQLFCYAAARRLAIANNAELVIDDVTGFARDAQYAREYSLDNFRIPARKATPAERLEPFERLRRGFAKAVSRIKPFPERSYLEQEGIDFDARLLDFKVRDTVYLDGLWQSEEYFRDIADVIRADLQIIPPADELNAGLAMDIESSTAVAVHVRWFEQPGGGGAHNLTAAYYKRAIAVMEERIRSPKYFLFSDNPEAAVKLIGLPENRVCVSNNKGQGNAYADLWLMSQCRHFITANSTFSWWGAWLGVAPDKFVVSPAQKMGTLTAWGFAGHLPDAWRQVQV